jgi:hypothetical protein
MVISDHKIENENCELKKTNERKLKALGPIAENLVWSKFLPVANMGANYD